MADKISAQIRHKYGEQGSPCLTPLHTPNHNKLMNHTVNKHMTDIKQKVARWWSGSTNWVKFLHSSHMLHKHKVLSSTITSYGDTDSAWSCKSRDYMQKTSKLNRSLKNLISPCQSPAISHFPKQSSTTQPYWNLKTMTTMSLGATSMGFSCMESDCALQVDNDIDTGGGGGSFLDCEDLGRMFNHSFPTCTFFFLFLFFLLFFGSAD